jgi:hypothetical protein
VQELQRRVEAAQYATSGLGADASAAQSTAAAPLPLVPSWRQDPVRFAVWVHTFLVAALLLAIAVAATR